MTDIKPDDKAPAWPKETALQRFVSCQMMLRMHDFLSDGESAKVRARMKKWAEKHGIGLKCPADGDVIGPDDRPI